jgi:hypothetical protein
MRSRSTPSGLDFTAHDGQLRPRPALPQEREGSERQLMPARALKRGDHPHQRFTSESELASQRVDRGGRAEHRIQERRHHPHAPARQPRRIRRGRHRVRVRAREAPAERARRVDGPHQHRSARPAELREEMIMAEVAVDDVDLSAAEQPEVSQHAEWARLHRQLQPALVEQPELPQARDDGLLGGRERSLALDGDRRLVAERALRQGRGARCASSRG